MLAVGYECGKINLIDIEDASILHSLSVASVVTSMAWLAHVTPDNEVTNNCYHDDSAHYQPKLPPFAKS